MKITMVGAGYVGLVTGACFAETGNRVVCLDIDQTKIDGLRQGRIPIYEPGLTELIARNVSLGRLDFTTDYAATVPGSRFVYIAVGTPQQEDGAANLDYLLDAVTKMAPHLDPSSIVVVKSTVPVGTNVKVFDRLKELTGRDFDVASNPEFLKEGAALEDFTKPDRVVVGVRRPEVASALHELYQPFLRTERPFLSMSPESSEMTKYVANAMLATKISFINEVANLCEKLKADVNDVRRGMGHDARIGFAFLFPGVGYGGSCFPKDVRALQFMARQHGVEPRMLAAVDEVNDAQKAILLDKITSELGRDLQGKRLAIWGLAFKPRTDDVREAPALVMIGHLLTMGAKLRVHDPVAMDNVRRRHNDQLDYAETPQACLDGADALLIMTEWKEFQSPDFADMRKRMKTPMVFDGRNLYSPDKMQAAGFTYHSIGRMTVRA